MCRAYTFDVPPETATALRKELQKQIKSAPIATDSECVAWRTLSREAQVFDDGISRWLVEDQHSYVVGLEGVANSGEYRAIVLGVFPPLPWSNFRPFPTFVFVHGTKRGISKITRNQDATLTCEILQEGVGWVSLNGNERAIEHDYDEQIRFWLQNRHELLDR
ncbi:MAG: hypothetical protein Q8Q18_01800 [bacterium]|nr:hypothetical protein [bacterium]